MVLIVTSVAPEFGRNLTLGLIFFAAAWAPCAIWTKNGLPRSPTVTATTLSFFCAKTGTASAAQKARQRDILIPNRINLLVLMFVYLGFFRIEVRERRGLTSPLV